MRPIWNFLRAAIIIAFADSIGKIPACTAGVIAVTLEAIPCSKSFNALLSSATSGAIVELVSISILNDLAPSSLISCIISGVTWTPVIA